MLKIEAVEKSFGPKKVLEGIDLTVGRGEVVCLIGASGSGKSTLLKCINLLEVVDDGSIWLRDREITDPRVNVDEVRAGLGMVFQSYNLFPHRTVLDNLTMGPRTVKKVSKAEAEERAHHLLARIGLADKAKSYPDSLSGGQQQRVALMRAVAMKPDVLLLDEVTSALDPMLVGEVLEVVAELKNEGLTMLMATHEMAFARDSADRVVFMSEGRIVEEGAPGKIFANPRNPRTIKFLARHRA